MIKVRKGAIEMISDEKINRINELANKKKTEGLTDKEQNEQDTLRKEYLQDFRGGMRKHIEGMKVVDPDGKDVTPEKLKKIQKKKGLHDR
ncbi:UPF0291 protein TEH_13440 [Tetragenococcus halophilus subsp. halophilus]|nr:UPF0291 protein TEH_13440 [Tetragenococcus halophilus subsp. halophilus]GBD69515.1 UPF0291 protein TEH_13440 [Tetragenococcus halophilus subsp. halophilus]GBD76910.1 UPF0291 protein TEH_13440 [Tetragenococcus halophilus subsp. halophilus]GBD80331.1 UPF0291 protein TEH_13440 [Tetragenococcus halophilus subsp. halophilus]